MKSGNWIQRLLLALALAALAAPSAFAEKAIDFQFTEVNGKTLHLSDYRGKWVLVNFWATWCPPCLEEIPELISLHNAHKGADLVVIGIVLDYPSRKGVHEFVEKHAIPYPIVLANHIMAEQVGEVGALPTTYLFDPSGKQVAHHEGVLTRDNVEEYIRSRKSLAEPF